MAYTMLKNDVIKPINDEKNTLGEAALTFIREYCEGLRFDKTKAINAFADNLDREGKSLRANQIPFNMEKDIDRLCLENAVERFLKSGKKEDAFDIYFCYLDMFVGDYKKTRRMIELLSEFEANGSSLLMKHRDHYSHSVYVFVLGLAIYRSNKIFRDEYKKYYNLQDEHEAAGHYLQYWGLSSLFHDIGYPFELPFEQVASYFEVDGDKREDRPFVAYHKLEAFTRLNKATQRRLGAAFGTGTEKILTSTDELFAYALYRKLGNIYYFSEEEMLQYLMQKPTKPNKFGYFIDHAYFSATVLFKKLFEDVKVDFSKDWDMVQVIDSLTAILLHNSLYKFSVAFYKNPDANIRLKMEWHPLAFMLMLCDELQCWDRIAYGRNSKLELYPMDCRFLFDEKSIKATYIFDECEKSKIDHYKKDREKNQNVKLKAFSSYDKKVKIIRSDGNVSEVTEFQADIEQIIDLSQILLTVDSSIEAHDTGKRKGYLSNSSFIHLYTFASVLNGRWLSIEDWNRYKENGNIEGFLSDKSKVEELQKGFGTLSLEYKLSNINQAKAFAKYLSEIGCFYTDKFVDFELVTGFTEDELLKIGILEHKRWLQEHYDMGWVFGNSSKDEREYLRQHKDLIENFEGQYYVTDELAKKNYDRLDKAEQDKDTEPMECMLAMLKLFDGLRIYRLS